MEIELDTDQLHDLGDSRQQSMQRYVHWPVRPVKTDFMFYISSRVRFSPKSGKICTNSYFAIFLDVFQISKFLMNKLSTSVLFCSFSNQCMGVCDTRSLTNREFSLFAFDRFQRKICTNLGFRWKSVCNCITFVQFSSCACVCLA